MKTALITILLSAFFPMSIAQATPCQEVFDRIFNGIFEDSSIHGVATITRVDGTNERLLTTSVFDTNKTFALYGASLRVSRIDELHQVPAIEHETIDLRIYRNGEIGLGPVLRRLTLNNLTCNKSANQQVMHFTGHANYYTDSSRSNRVFETWNISIWAEPAVRYDYGTACTVGRLRMHCCPPGEVMAGAHIGRNVFKCIDYNNQSFTGRNRFLDRTTRRNNMRACPGGAAMVGYHHGQNAVACEYPTPILEWDFRDTNTSDGFMHICRNNSVMVGIDVPNNIFTCGFQ